MSWFYLISSTFRDISMALLRCIFALRFGASIFQRTPHTTRSAASASLQHTPYAAHYIGHRCRNSQEHDYILQDYAHDVNAIMNTKNGDM